MNKCRSFDSINKNKNSRFSKMSLLNSFDKCNGRLLELIIKFFWQRESSNEGKIHNTYTIIIKFLWSMIIMYLFCQINCVEYEHPNSSPKHEKGAIRVDAYLDLSGEDIFYGISHFY